VKYRFRPTRNKENLLESYSDVQLLNAIGVPITNRKFTSPFRNDKHADCRIMLSDNGRTYYMDYALYGTRGMDVFALVMDIYNISFNEAIGYLWDITEGSIQGKSIVAKEVLPQVHRPNPAVIEVQPRGWTSFDLQWWMSFGIGMDILDTYNVRAVQSVWVGNVKQYSYFRGVNPAYSYHFQGFIKVYYPFNRKHRFITNTGSALQGYEQLPENGRYIVLTKSMKDVMLLARYKVPAVAPQSESIICSDQTMDGLKDRFDNILVVMDNDKAGKRALIKWREKGYNVGMLPYKNGVKDISDFYLKFGPHKTRDLVLATKKHYL